jgi:aryl-alcohol dehydrogenase-like predicted oxidoreductase
MKFRFLGDTGVQVSELALGSWLTYGAAVGISQTRACVKAAFDLGINLFDTADVYADGRAEQTLGGILKDFPRSEYVIATKCFFPHADKPGSGGLSRQHVFACVEGNLRRLRVDEIDILQAHRFDPNVELAVVVETFTDLVRAGKIRHWGVSKWTTEQIQDAIGMAQQGSGVPPVVTQLPLSLLYREYQPAMAAQGRLGLGGLVYSPLAQGVLTGKYGAGKIPEGSRANYKATAKFVYHANAKDLGLTERYAKACAEHGIRLSHAALLWCLEQKGVSSVIMGAKSFAQIRDNTACLNSTLPPEVRKFFETERV